MENLKNILEISVSLKEQIIDILSGHMGNAFTINGIISELTDGFRVEMFSHICFVNTIESFYQYSNVFEFYALVFHILENMV